jgi:hypothetical protein
MTTAKEYKMSRRLTDIAIAARVVPTMLRWPSSEIAAWDRLRESVEALRKILRALDDACHEVEHDRHINPQDIRRRRNELGERALRQLADFKSVLIAERALNENIDNLEANMQPLLTKALGELREGVEAAKRAVIERCQMRAFVH